MRLKLMLQPQQQHCVIPINYQYPLSAAIYRILNSASPEYADFLHRQGYHSANGKPLKLFTFSRIHCPNIQRKASNLIINGKRICHLLITSPMLTDFIQNLVIGLFQQQELVIGGTRTVGRFIIMQVETMPDPEFRAEMKFTCLSPIVLSTMRQYAGKLTTYYYRPNDPHISDAIANNLRQKYQLVHGQPADHFSVTFVPDQQYITRRLQQGKRVTRKITIKEGQENEATDIISFEVPFTLHGSPELIQVAYDCGIGEKNSLGFGMAAISSF